jgi:hypothetical protein
MKVILERVAAIDHIAIASRSGLAAPGAAFSKQSRYEQVSLPGMQPTRPWPSPPWGEGGERSEPGERSGRPFRNRAEEQQLIVREK